MVLCVKTSSLSIGTQKQPLTVVGRSRAGEATSFYLKELNWQLDCGCLIGGRKPRAIFVTHTHQDHVSSLIHLGDKSHPPNVYLPVVAAPYVDQYLRSHKSMVECKKILEGDKIDFQLTPLLPCQEFRIRQGRSFVIRTISCCHRIDCLGYSILEEKFRLKEEYKSLTGREIGALHRKGIPVKESTLEPVVCFLGDTTHKVFETHPEILSQHRVIMIECTFLLSQDIERAIETTHIHWDNLRPVVEAHPDTLFVLIHFSLKYKAIEVRRFFQRYPNIHPMLVEDEVESEYLREKQSVDADNDGTIPRCQCRVCGNPNAAVSLQKKQ